MCASSRSSAAIRFSERNHFTAFVRASLETISSLCGKESVAQKRGRARALLRRFRRGALPKTWTWRTSSSWNRRALLPSFLDQSPMKYLRHRRGYGPDVWSRKRATLPSASATSARALSDFSTPSFSEIVRSSFSISRWIFRTCTDEGGSMRLVLSLPHVQALPYQRRTITTYAEDFAAGGLGRINSILAGSLVVGAGFSSWHPASFSSRRLAAARLSSGEQAHQPTVCPAESQGRPRRSA